MITVVINGSVYRFPSMKTAELWMEENPEIYDFDKSKLLYLTDQYPENSVTIKSTLFVKQCPACNSFIKFEKEPTERIDGVICPVCEYRINPS